MDINTKVSYKYEVDLVKTALEINPNSVIEKEVIINEKKIDTRLSDFKIIIISLT